MGEEEATEEGRYYTPPYPSHIHLILPCLLLVVQFTDHSLKFISAKYFNRTIPIPELTWYTTLSLALPHEGLFPEDFTAGLETHSNRAFEGLSSRAFEGVVSSAVEGLVLTEAEGRRKKKAVRRRISVSSSEGDVDIEEVLSGVVREYEGMRGLGRGGSGVKGGETSGKRG